MNDGPPRRIAFLGFGLIGGSVARALRAPGSGAAAGSRHRPALVAWSPSNAGPEAAVRDGVLDLAVDTPAEAVRDADLVVVGAPPIEAIDLVRALGGELRPALSADAVVTDVVSTKADIVAAADRAGLRFVGGHPMAGRERSGYGAATDDLFAGRPWVIVPGTKADPPAVDRVTWLAVACGARPVRLDPAAHDAAAAAISHLPLVLAASLVEAVAAGGDETAGSAWTDAAALAASGWRDTTRLALGDPRMGAGIAATNATNVAAGLRRLRTVIDTWLEELERAGGPDASRLEARLREARTRLERSTPAT